jgi:hypothetical protein
MDKFKADIAKVESKHVDEVVDNLDKLLHKLYEGAIANFIKKANSLVIEKSNWATKVIVFVNELKAHLTDLMDGCKKAILNKMENQARKAHELNMKAKIHDVMDVLAESIALDTRNAYTECVKDFNDNMRPVLNQGFGMSDEDASYFLQ